MVAAATSHAAAAPVAALAADTVSVPAVIDTYVVAERPSLAYGTENKLTAATWTRLAQRELPALRRAGAAAGPTASPAPG